MKLIVQPPYVNAAPSTHSPRCGPEAEGKLHGIPGSKSRTSLTMTEGPYVYP